MCGQEFETATPRTHRFVPVAPHRSEGADGRFARRAKGNAGCGQDPPRGIIGGVAGRNQTGAQSRSDRECPEPVQHWEPAMGKHTHLLRKGGSWLYAVVSDWGKQRLESWRRIGSDRQKSWRNGRATCPGVAPGAITGDAADSRHVISRASGRK